MTLIEALSPPGSPGDMYEVFRIRPVVVDSSFLLPDVFWTTRNLKQSSFLDSIDFGVVRPFAAHHVWAEVPRKMAATAWQFGCDESAVERIWWNEYAPRIRFVDAGDLHVPRLSEISARDVSDAPTFALAGLLAPVVVLAPDRDITDLGIATSDWVAVVRAGEELTFVASSAMGGLFGINLGGYSIAGSVKGLLQALKHPVGQIVLGATAIYGAFTFRRWLPPVRTGVPRIIGAVGSFLEAVVPIVEAISDQYQTASAVWNDAAYGSESMTLQQQVARALAASPAPISRTSIAKVLLPEGSEQERRVLSTELAQVLSSSQAFVNTHQSRWQLGKTGPDFGMDDFERATLTERSGIPETLADKLKDPSRPSLPRLNRR